MEYPVIDRRDKKIIKEQIQTLASVYVPEWNINQDGSDVGSALVDLFATMFSDTVESLNRQPFANYVQFLNCIRVKLSPGTPAKGMVTVLLNEGTEPGVYIKKGTQLYVDKGDKDGQILYETQHDCFAVDNQVTHIFCADGFKNIITKPFDYQESIDLPIHLFNDIKYKNLQIHRVYMASEDLLNIRQGAQLEIELQHKVRRTQVQDMAEQLADPSYFRWTILTDQGWKTISEVKASGNRVLLTINEKFPVCNFEEEESRWLSCQFISDSDIPEIWVEDFRLALRAEEVQPEILIYNDLELRNHNILPFGENFTVYDDFYIGCEEVLTKKGSSVTMNFRLTTKRFRPTNPFEQEIEWKMVMNEKDFKKEDPFEITIEEVLWEYWNGDGWARLFFDEKAETMFSHKYEEVQNIQVTFTCPEDTALGYINAHHNYWIRARIRKVQNAYKQNVIYQSPLIESLTFSYQYDQASSSFDHLVIERDLKASKVSFEEHKEVALFQQQKPLEMATYFCLKNPLQGGPITLYFALNKQKERSDLPLRWEYLGLQGGEQQWLPLKLSDETNMLSQSGIVMLTGKSNAVRSTFFAQQGYWIRLVCQEDLISSREKIDLPELQGFHFNTIKIRQQETHLVEYFSIEPHEAGKSCDLLGENILWHEVWIDEEKSLTEQEWLQLIEEGKYQTQEERDDAGRIIRRWIKWKPVEDVLMAEAEERSYMVDEYYGRVFFGNDINGRIPPAGTGDTIRIFYRTSKGEQGNLKAGELNSFADAVPYVNQVYNVEPVLGGTNKESLEKLKRGPSLLSHRHSAVTMDDFTNLVKEADRNIVKVRCLRHQNQQGLREIGAMTIAVLPVFYNKGITYFETIRNRVLEMVKSQGLATISYSNKLYIVETKYLEINMEVKVVVADYNDYHSVLQEVEKNLKAFLDPIQGNHDGKGWSIGEYPNREKLYHVIKQQKKIRRVDGITITSNLMSPEGKEAVDLNNKELFALSVPIGGDIVIDIAVG
ncbi:hypothetical protein F9B85_10340 [Heliorestis acidaminivorans]|uniref:Uncharacterized protein n=1 Tax=Heliorestis acidaminivorans TaxID=553427 RepID=A0A6I0EVJ7_9FIRM|nr:baseplate J/gp47 family protein [Heliorestis acidaminivorans]KAB2951948.1 hypothetical protein F9B85_10340 [Heliorestis acidaminivorans]